MRANLFKNTEFKHHIFPNIDTKDFDFNFVDFDDFNDISIPPDVTNKKSKSNNDFQPTNNNNNNNNKNNNVIFHKYFSKEFICNNISQFNSINKRDQLKYQSSDKIILPHSSLNAFASQSNDSLYVLKVLNPKNFKYAFVGIGDFIAPERHMYVPHWLMKSLEISPEDKIYVDAISVPKVSYAKIKIPDDLKSLIDNNKNISMTIDLKTIIEFILHNHSLLFLGKKLEIKIFEKTWAFEVTALKPANIGSIINTDVQLDLS